MMKRIKIINSSDFLLKGLAGEPFLAILSLSAPSCGTLIRSKMDIGGPSYKNFDLDICLGFKVLPSCNAYKHTRFRLRIESDSKPRDRPTDLETKAHVCRGQNSFPIGPTDLISMFKTGVVKRLWSPPSIHLTSLH